MTAAAFILAAGLGTRLRPLTLHRPKPLVPVCGVPVLDQALALCLRHGIHRVVVNAHHLSGAMEAHLARVADLSVVLQVEEPQVLGTGGGLRLAMDSLDDPFVVLNADVLCDADLPQLVSLAGEPGVDAAMLLRVAPDAARYGVVSVDGDGRVVRLASVASLDSATPVSSDTHFTGIHALRREALARVPPGGPACVVRTAYQELVPLGRVRGLVHGGYWMDIGSPEDYLATNMAVLEGGVALILDPMARAGLAQVGEVVHGSLLTCEVAPTARLRPPFLLGPAARIGPGAVIGPGAIVGAGADVGSGASLRRTVVWDHVEVPAGATLDGAVVYDGGILELGGALRS